MVVVFTKKFNSKSCLTVAYIAKNEMSLCKQNKTGF